MNDNTMDITKLKVELTHQKTIKQHRLNTIDIMREIKQKYDYDNLIQQFEEQCNLIDEDYINYQIEQQAQEEQEKQKYDQEIYEKNMLADENWLNLNDQQILDNNNTQIDEEYII